MNTNVKGNGSEERDKFSNLPFMQIKKKEWRKTLLSGSSSEVTTGLEQLYL